MKKVKIWCDGACAGNPGPGAYAYLLKYGEHEKIECFGHPETTTNQQMELMAAIGALGALKVSVR
jgi:ribonuclease HI